MNERLRRLMIELRWPLSILALAATGGAIMAAASWYVGHSKIQEYRQVQNRLRAAQLALNNVRQDAADLETYRAPFEELSKHGLFGQEQRLNWVEYMTGLSTTGRLQSLSYDIASQRPVSVTALPQAGSVEVLASRIQLKMGFLHEENFVQMIEELRQSGNGFYRLETCTVKRKEGILASQSNENIVADCKLQWITMRSRSGGK